MYNYKYDIDYYINIYKYIHISALSVEVDGGQHSTLVPLNVSVE